MHDVCLAHSSAVVFEESKGLGSAEAVLRTSTMIGVGTKVCLEVELVAELRRRVEWVGGGWGGRGEIKRERERERER
jgi:hypothetical protein